MRPKPESPHTSDVPPTDTATAVDHDEAVADLLSRLRQASYRFVMPSRRTALEGRLRRLLRHGDPLRDAFGWNKTFRADELDPALFEMTRSAGIIRRGPFGLWRSRLRVSSLGEALVVHSPLFAGANAVFFGPDSYRFARFLQDKAALLPQGARVVDLGCGAGVGAIALGARRPDLQWALVDINPVAIRLARLNLAAAGLKAEFFQGDGLAVVPGAINAVIANPPFLGGNLRGTYRAGGGSSGAAVTLAWIRNAATRLGLGGTILLYGASAIINGEDRLGDTLTRELAKTNFAVFYQELDPDAYGGMLWRPAYRGVERIALVTMVATRLR